MIHFYLILDLGQLTKQILKFRILLFFVDNSLGKIPDLGLITLDNSLVQILHIINDILLHSFNISFNIFYHQFQIYQGIHWIILYLSFSFLLFITHLLIIILMINNYLWICAESIGKKVEGREDLVEKWRVSKGYRI